VTDPQDWIDELYLGLLKQGWTLNDIDTMDIGYYLHLVKKAQNKETAYIDEIL
jgi:hypothetical protein